VKIILSNCNHFGNIKIKRIHWKALVLN